MLRVIVEGDTATGKPKVALALKYMLEATGFKVRLFDRDELDVSEAYHVEKMEALQSERRC